MSVLVVGPAGLADEVAQSLAADAVVHVGGPVKTFVAAARRGRPETLVTVSGPAWLPVLARLLRARRWIAHVVDAPRLPAGHWARLLDPRARALRRADVVTAAPGAADVLHRTVGIALAGDDPAAVAPVATGGLKILMFGSVNTPHIEHLATAMRDRGHTVVVAGHVTASYAPSVLPAAGIQVRPLEAPASLWMRRVYRRERPAVVHANWLPSYAFIAALGRLKPLVAMAWGSDVYGATPAQTRRSRYAVRRADVAMSDSEDLVRRLAEMGARETFVLNWGVELDTFAPPDDRVAVRRALGLGDGPVVLSPRALRPLYNPAVIVEAFERAAGDAPGAQLLLKHIEAGDPDLGRPLPAAARIVGHVPYEQLPDYYRAADICVSIPDSDSSPRSVWEAMAAGCACVISDLPWAHELIEDGEHALIVPPRVEPVAAALRRLLTEPGLADRLGRNARALVERHRDARAEMDRLAALYARLAR